MGLEFGLTVFSKLESLMDDGNCTNGVCQIKNRPESFALQNLLNIQEQVMQMCIFDLDMRPKGKFIRREFSEPYRRVCKALTRLT